ncbi:uncharacterized protein LOC125075704 [Vanessa atalanta]|uniref:uncharacterized protein LOC125075704 n=1 Tax=Vanessa atalanta TaxID=42275 RepID=UPI001FCD1DD8|nr:uncharacterized protein LOC125075704 [Vanessa atalanta]
MFTILLLLLFVNLSCSLENSEKYNSTDGILCRFCGSHLLSSDKITSKHSPTALYTFNDTLFNRNEVLVQLLSKDGFLQIPVITSSQSTCVGQEEWEEKEIWFPGYTWKPCFCPECGILIGWMFEHHNPKIVEAHDQFFGLILGNLISENFTNSLIKYPNSFL